MSADTDLLFKGEGAHTWVRTPMSVAALIRDWGALRARMIRQHPAAFSRDEWAYLIRFTAPERLWQPWHDAFGPQATQRAPATWIASPARRVALWLPNNVSLLGCLTLVLLSLTGAEVKVKSGSRSDDLCAPFAQFALDNLPEGPLRTWFAERLEVRSFGREDPANEAMSRWADARIFFGGDEGAASVARLPSRLGTPFAAFAHKVSEAWLTPRAARDPAVADTLARVFAIYGQAGCTSPKRAVIVGGSRADGLDLAQQLTQLWASSVRQRPGQAQASEVFMAAQWARAEGLEARTLPDNAAVLVLSPVLPARSFAHFGLQIQWGTLADIVSSTAANLQTIGSSEEGEQPREWSEALLATSANRMAPIGRMHDFSHVWDGQAWWRNLFRIIET